MKRFLAISGCIALAVLIVGIASVRTDDPDQNPDESGRKRGSADGPPARESAGISATKSSNERGLRGKLKDLEKLGFTIVAERVGTRSAEGGVKITGPDGVHYWGDDFRVSDQDGNFLLTGAVGMRQGGSSVVAMDDDLFIRVNVNGDIYCAPGRWETSEKISNKAAHANPLPVPNRQPNDDENP